MIAHDFIYARPDTKEEATQLYSDFARQNIAAMYYGGGSEIITMCRAGSIAPGAVIDLKRISECNALRLMGGGLTIGGCVTLREIKDSKCFPLLGTICGRIADHTNQCRITLGGNLCASIIYRETAQALLIAEAEILLFGPGGFRTLRVAEAFDKRMRLTPGEFFLQARIPAGFIDRPYFHVKKTGSEKIDYPLISVSAMRCEEGMRIAISGYTPYPFRDTGLEAAFNKRQDARTLPDCLSEPPIGDYQGSSEYRRFVLAQTLARMMEAAG